MPVALNLRTTEMETFEAAMKAGKIDFKVTNRNTVELSSTNVHPILGAVLKFREKKVAIKTKSLPNMEAAFNCQEIEKKISAVLHHFPAPANDGEIGLVEIVGAEVSQEQQEINEHRQNVARNNADDESDAA